MKDLEHIAQQEPKQEYHLHMELDYDRKGSKPSIPLRLMYQIRRLWK